MKNFYAILVLLGAYGNVFGQCTHTVPFSGSNTITANSGTICEHAGTGNYSNNANGFTVINPVIPGDMVRLTFTSFALECCCDFVTVFNGVGVGAPILFNGNCTTLPPVITSTTGSLTIRFTSDGSVVNTGFSATISNIAPLTCTHTVPFIGSNTITANSGTICEHAGLGNYSNNANGFTIINPVNVGDAVRLTFNSNASSVMGAVFGWFQSSTGFVFSNIYYNSDLYSSCIGNNYNNVTFTCNSGSTADMNQQNHFSGYDFVNTWGIDPTINDGYPYLIQNQPPIDCNNFLAEAPSLDNGVYQISTFNHLRWISENNSSWGADFIQTADIDAAVTSESCYNSGAGWLPIGNSTTKFTGSYDGDGHTISNLFINRPNNQRIALFGETNGASIQNLGLIDPDITVTGTGQFGMGSNVGSLVGLADNGTTITECFASGGVVTAGGSGVGGLIGQLLWSSLNNSYAIVAVEGGDADINYSGGLVGVNSSSTITNCYAAGSVAFKQYNTGFGFLTISRGLTQGSNGITNSFYDSDATGQTTGGGTAKTTAEMQQQATFTNWDFQCEAANGTANIWGIDEGNDYPRLSWEGIVQLCKSWIGSIDTDWSNPNNWSPSGVPTQNENLIIDATAQNNLILNQDHTVGNITFNAANANIKLNSYDLTFTGLILGADASNYIQTNGTGKLKANITSNDTVRFEVGRSAYNPVEIQPSVTDTFAVAVLDTVMYNNYLNAAIYVNRTWEITKTDTMAGGSVNFVYYWNANEIVNGPMNAPILNHYNGNNWENANGINTPGGGNPILSLTHTNYTGAFSPFAISDASTPLPVEFLGMQYECLDQQGVSLTWQTASELNAQHFEVMRSEDGFTWGKVGTVTATGTTNQLSDYQFVDESPVRTALRYYQLKQVDFDGNFEWLPIISVNCDSEEENYLLYPNPAQDRVTLSFNSKISGIASVQLTDATGRIVSNTTYPIKQGNNILLVDTMHLNNGWYTVVINNGTSKALKFVIIK